MTRETESKAMRAAVRDMKRRLTYALALSSKGQNEVAREVGASNAVASEWFNETSETLPGGRFLMRLPKVLGVGAAWLVTGEGNWHPEPVSGRKDILFMEGLDAGVRGTLAEMRAAIARSERQLAEAHQASTAKARAAFEDASADDPGAAVPGRVPGRVGPR